MSKVEKPLLARIPSIDRLLLTPVVAETITARISPCARAIATRLSPDVTMIAPPPTNMRAKVPTNSARNALEVGMGCSRKDRRR